jgi:hypothetical protein
MDFATLIAVPRTVSNPQVTLKLPGFPDPIANNKSANATRSRQMWSIMG